VARRGPGLPVVEPLAGHAQGAAHLRHAPAAARVGLLLGDERVHGGHSLILGDPRRRPLLLPGCPAPAECAPAPGAAHGSPRASLRSGYRWPADRGPGAPSSPASSHRCPARWRPQVSVKPGQHQAMTCRSYVQVIVELAVVSPAEPMSTPVPRGGLDGGGAGVGGVVVLDGKRVMSPVWAMRIAAHTAPIPNSSVSDVDDAATAASTRRFESRRAVSMRRGAHRRQRSYGDGLTPFTHSPLWNRPPLRRSSTNRATATTKAAC
jgi:hypothetical protein